MYFQVNYLPYRQNCKLYKKEYVIINPNFFDITENAPTDAGYQKSDRFLLIGMMLPSRKNMNDFFDIIIVQL